MLPLRETSEAGAEASYLAIRCAVLYVAPIAYAGTDRFDEDDVGRATETFTKLTTAAVSLRVNQNNRSEDLVEQAVLADAQAIMGLYLDRFENNYAISGQAFGADDLYASDVEFCASTFGLS